LSIFSQLTIAPVSIMSPLRPLDPSTAGQGGGLIRRAGGADPVAAIPVGLDRPRPRLPANVPGWGAFLSMAFRPFYLLAALFVAAAVLAWVAGWGGGGSLGGLYWHAHEMIWGYAGAIIVGFLLTAVVSWTGRPALAGGPLAGLAGLWLAARLAASVDVGSILWPAGLSLAFYLAAVLALTLPIVHSRNRRNYAVPFLLLGFAATNLLFHLAVAGWLAIDSRGLLHAGLVVVAAIICFVGLRVIPFFAHRALAVPQVGHGMALLATAVASPLVLAACLALGMGGALPLLAGLLGMVVNLERLLRWWRPAALGHPLLWILFAGYGCTAVGIGLVGVAQAGVPWLLSGALHCIAVGGVGVLTLGMMTRTALGHTGRKLELPRAMVAAYGLMLMATALRLLAAFPLPLAGWSLTASGVCFALAFLLFAWRYAPWLVSTRADGLP
jgi:uncharacterized protein involved in response to NO